MRLAPDCGQSVRILACHDAGIRTVQCSLQIGALSALLGLLLLSPVNHFLRDCVKLKPTSDTPNNFYPYMVSLLTYFPIRIFF
jgi:hypothetical protein